MDSIAWVRKQEKEKAMYFKALQHFNDAFTHSLMLKKTSFHIVQSIDTCVLLARITGNITDDEDDDDDVYVMSILMS